MGTFLVQEDAATAWYHASISGTSGQSKWGSIEGQSTDGQYIAPFVTWDAKITTVLAMMGGLVAEVKARL